MRLFHPRTPAFTFQTAIIALTSHKSNLVRFEVQA